MPSYKICSTIWNNSACSPALIQSESTNIHSLMFNRIVSHFLDSVRAKNDRRRESQLKDAQWDILNTRGMKSDPSFSESGARMPPKEWTFHSSTVRFWVRVGNVILLQLSQVSIHDMLLNRQNQQLGDAISAIVVVMVNSGERYTIWRQWGCSKLWNSDGLEYEG